MEENFGGFRVILDFFVWMRFGRGRGGFVASMFVFFGVFRGFEYLGSSRGWVRVRRRRILFFSIFL